MQAGKCLKKAGAASQREVEHYMLEAIESGKLKDIETIDVKMTPTEPAIDFDHFIEETKILK